MHLHELLRQHPHLIDTFNDVFGSEAIAHALRLGAAYRLAYGYALLIDPRSPVPPPGEAFAIAPLNQAKTYKMRMATLPLKLPSGNLGRPTPNPTR